MNKTVPAVFCGCLLESIAYADILDSDSATVSMDVGLYASITGLDPLDMEAQDGGFQNIIFSGSDTFHLESNGSVRVAVIPGDLETKLQAKSQRLTRGGDQQKVQYSIDGSGMTYDTAADSTHDSDHTVAIKTTFSQMEWQRSGDYDGSFSINISAL